MNRWERKGARRKARDEQKADENDDSNDVIDVSEGKTQKQPILMQYPHQQPTHAGFLTSATLFPKQ